ncbi:MAG: hypothetical protein L6R00_21400 [Phycisphaerae bacterium]|nr:hypothetical protein [Phycisphaerae bacterium]
MTTARIPLFSISITACLCFCQKSVYGQTIWYVDADVNTNQLNDGTSWATAYPTIQEALADAATNGVPADEIWVARGTYISNTQASSTFNLKHRVKVFGGFAGTESNRDERDEDPLTNETILTCDVSGSTAIVRAVGGATIIPDVTELNGFTVTGASQHGIVNKDSDATFGNLWIVANGALPGNGDFDGGGMYIDGEGTPTLSNCRFESNLATAGGALFIKAEAAPRVTDCFFIDNHTGEPQATNAIRGGGAVYCGVDDDNARITFRRCTFQENTAAGGSGGGLLKVEAASLDLIQCKFLGNRTFAPTIAVGADLANGGGLSTEGGQVRLVNCVFAGNDAGVYVPGAGVIRGGGGWFLRKPTIAGGVNCLFYANETDEGQGGAILNSMADQTLINFTVSRNAAPRYSGVYAIVDVFGSASVMTNCILWGNLAGPGFGVQDAQLFAIGDDDVTYSCVQDDSPNDSNVYPGQCNIDMDPIFEAPEVYNFHLCPDSPCIDHGDTTAVPLDDLDLDMDEGADCPSGTAEPTPDLDIRDRVIDPDEEEQTCAVSITQCGLANQVVDMGAYEFRDVVCVTGVSGDVNRDGLLDGDDIQPFIYCLYITSDQPIGECTCADMNLDRVLDINDVACFVESLLAGEVLCVPTGGCPFEPLIDCNTNEQYDAIDLYFGTSLDCNGNFVPDECDVAGPTSLDANENGVPDECEGDCNGNGLPDDVDVAGATSDDVNSNGVPDECEPDCNENGTPDDYDIATAFSYDCNSNDRPDECELDCNTNGIPDCCDVRDHASSDCSTNFLPDECDLMLPFIPSIDCDTNGTLDECDLAAGTAWDCNTNDTLDLCDIALEQSEDADTNGIPDECDVVEQMQYGESQQNNESPENDCAGEGLESLQIWLLERDVHLLERWQRHALFDKRARQLGLW